MVIDNEVNLIDSVVLLNYKKECMKFFIYLFTFVSFSNLLIRDFENFKYAIDYIKIFFLIIS